MYSVPTRRVKGIKVRTLSDPELLKEMLHLRKCGWTTVALGKKYGKDHSTIVYHCQKHEVVVELNSKEAKQSRYDKYTFHRSNFKTNTWNDHPYKKIIEEGINEGMMYDQYLEKQGLLTHKDLMIS